MILAASPAHETATGVVILIVSAIGLAFWAAAEFTWPARRNKFMTPWRNRKPGDLS